MILYLLLFLAFFAYRLGRHGMLFRRLGKEIGEIREELGKAVTTLEKLHDAPVSTDEVGALLADRMRLESPPYRDERELLALGRVCFLVSRHDQLVLRFNSQLEMTPQSWVAKLMKVRQRKFMGEAPLAVMPSNLNEIG